MTKFEELVEQLLVELGDPDAERAAVASANRERDQRMYDMGSRGYSSSSRDSFKRREQNAGLEREDKAEKMYWTVHKMVDHPEKEGYLKDAGPLRSKDGKAFGAFGLGKAQAMLSKIASQPFNKGKHFSLYNNDGVSWRQFLFGR